MKNKFNALFSSKKDDWETPDELFNQLNKTYNFAIDIAANPENAKCPVFLTKQDNALKYNSWIDLAPKGALWLNPPYGRGMGEWLKRCLKTSQDGRTVVALLPARTDTLAWHDYIFNQKNVKIDFIKGRLKFKGAKSGAPFPSAVIHFLAID